jgi:hypothetical protein
VTPRPNKRRWGWGAASLVAVGLGLSGCGIDLGFLQRFLLKAEDIIVERRPDAVYEQLFPFYVEICTLSQWGRQHESTRGNPFGHAVMYVKGACKDETAPYPQLRRCHRTATALDDPEHGAGVSVGQWFRNVNWVAVPGYQLFYTGNLKPGQRLTQAHFDATVQEAIDRGVFDGVQLHDGWTTEQDRSWQAYVSRTSIGTDFALQFSRNVFCARVPVPEPALNEVIAFLNDKNHEYATSDVDYNWRLLSHNCVHTVRNALAAANFWAPISVLRVKLWHLFNLAVPAHEFVNLAILGAAGPLDDYREIFDEDPLRDALHEFRWLPTRHGALVKTLPVHEPNDIFTTGFRLFTVQSPVNMGKSQSAVRLLSDPRYVDLKSNLLFFRDKYDAILARENSQAAMLASVRGTPYRRVSRLYAEYIRAQRQDVERMLSQLPE